MERGQVLLVQDVDVVEDGGFGGGGVEEILVTVPGDLKNNDSSMKFRLGLFRSVISDRHIYNYRALETVKRRILCC